VKGCDKCMCWTVDRRYMYYAFVYPSRYFPAEMVQDGGLLLVIDITLMNAYNFSQMKLLDGWTNTKFYVYGAYCGISQKVLESVVIILKVKRSGG
jgi:hypothetical protein